MLKTTCLSLSLLGYSLLMGLAGSDSLKTYTLPTVRVIVDKPTEAIGAIKQIYPQDNSGAQSLREVFLNSVGISASTGSKDESNLRIRGFRKSSVKILIDGRAISNGYFGNVDISKLSVMGIKEIHMIKGPASPLYGSGGMGGVVNIITLEPTSKNKLSLNAGVKRNNTGELQLRTSNSFSTWDYSLGLGALSSDGFVLSKAFTPTYFENGGVRNNSAKAQYNILGSTSFDVFNFHRIGIDFSYSGMRRKYIPSSIYERKYRMYKDWARYNSGIWGKFHLSDEAELTTQLSYDGGGDRYLEYNDADHQFASVNSRMDNETYSFAPRLRLQPKHGRTFDLGMKMEAQINTRQDTGNYKEGAVNRLYNGNAFSQFEAYIPGNLLLTAGMGISASVLDDVDMAKLSIEPALGISHTASSGAKSSIAIGRSTANPTLRQLFSSDKGNPNLKPEHSTKLEISHSHPLLIKDITLSGTVFYNDMRDLIDLQGNKYANIYKVASFGAELDVAVSLLKWWNSELEYCYLNYAKNGSYQITETPKHALEIANRISLPHRCRLRIVSSFRSSRQSQDDLGTYHTLAEYWTHDINLDIPIHRMEISLGIDNTLDTDYQGEYGFPEEGRNFHVGMLLNLF